MRSSFLRRWASAPAIAVAVFVASPADAKLNRTGDARTSFVMTTSLNTRVEGTTTEMSVLDDGTLLTIRVPLANIRTGVELQDLHVKQALEVDKYPNADLRVTRALLKLPTPSSGSVKATLTLHGQTKDVDLHYTTTLAGATLSIRGTVAIDVRDFGLKPPTLQGVVVNPKVDLATSFQATDN